MSAASASSASGERRQFIGRPTNNVGLGIVGLPNVGKSTLFNALSKLNVPAENYPFCTIDPKDARVPVPDSRFDFLVQTFKPKSVVPAVLTVTDIAGLVKGAHEGKGLGNAFLSHINAVDAIYHVVRGFSDDSIEHVEGSVDPTRDLEIISEELQLKDLEKVNARWESVKRVVERGADKTKKQDLETLTKAKELLEAKKDIRSHQWNTKDIEILNQELFLTSKPIVYLVNISEQEYITKKNKWLKKIYDWIKSRDQFAELIPFSAAFETKLDKFSTEEEKKKYCEDNKCTSALSKIILAGYHCLDLIHFFTAGEDEVRAWTLRRGTVAPGAAGVIHTDFQKNFVCAEVMTFEHFKEYGSEGAVKAAGKYKTQGKLYEVQDGDIIYFKHSAGGKKK